MKLRRTTPQQRQVALILANYPNKDGRLANGVGLDTPASCVEILKALKPSGYTFTPGAISSEEIFSATGIHRAPVIEDEQLVGIVSITDILVKGYPGSLSKDELSQRVQAALQHARIVDDEDTQIRQECNIAWQVFEEMQPAFSDAPGSDAETQISS